MRCGSTASCRTCCGISRMWIGGKSAFFGFGRIDVGQRRVGCAQIDADVHAATRSRTLNSSFQRRPSLATHQSCSMPVSVTTVSNVTRAIAPSSPLRQVYLDGREFFELIRHLLEHAPGASSLRTAEVKKRNSAGSPTIRPNSRSGNLWSVPSSMPNGATVSALSGAGSPARQASRFRSRRNTCAAMPPRMRTPLPGSRETVIGRAAGDGVHQIFAGKHLDRRACLQRASHWFKCLEDAIAYDAGAQDAAVEQDVRRSGELGDLAGAGTSRGDA